ncbi:cell division protein ZipA [Pseudoalteromonas piratica]|uniref:Cell division protein ZipA n=1 Tax=Pseudoalteromonas piratica TaxID=1348114 RepID=A0A0A7EID6_9GAMM|nr:cell division protein ZipA [Pseudoalteromonas piratica]AIY65826.1 cell division protein ZipA [Pseudoalteromonas piratica]
MSDELRWVLIIGGALVIGGVLLHGLWSIRKNDSRTLVQEPSEAPNKDDVAPATTKSAAIEPQVDAKLHVNDEPELGDLSITIDDDEPQPEVANEPEQAEDGKTAVQDYIIIHIQTEEGLPMQGSSLLPLLLTLGFKYSEDGFFNRHEDASGQGPVLFRLANMFNPGTFDIDNMEQFSTEGVSLFMTLPCAGDSLPSFNMLHSAAKKIADEFSATILDHNRQELDVATVRQYVEKIREFDGL